MSEVAVDSGVDHLLEFKCGQAFEENADGFIWNASIVLLRYLEAKQAKNIRGRRVLEMGSGLGHCAYGLARMGAHVTCTEQAKCIPVLEESLAKLERQMGPVAEKGGSLRLVELLWGEEGLRNSALSSETGVYDVIISAECVFLEELHQDLLWSLDHFSGPDTIIWSVFLNRPFSLMFLVHVDDSKAFQVTQLEEGRDYDSNGLEEDLFLHKITRKSGAIRGTED